MTKTVFRDLPGIADLEARCLRTHLMRPEEREALNRDLDTMSLRLFGITFNDTIRPYFPDGTPYTQEVADAEAKWENYFTWPDEDDGDEYYHMFWENMGVDVTNPEGDVLECMCEFERQFIVAFRQFHPAAFIGFPTNLSDGTTRTDEQTEAAAEAWGRRLLEKD